jgi:peptide-methionine (R)-S-oxide reductase
VIDKIKKTDAQWRAALSPEAHAILREKGTEPAFTGCFWDHKGEGVYSCAACNQELFASGEKFDSGSGWPSFTAAMSEGNIRQESDRTHGMVRTEVLCGRCDSHLGHVFPDGPAPSGLRYCINSAALTFAGPSHND